MLNKLGLKLVSFLFKRNLTLEQRNELITYIMKDLGSLPIHGIITTSDTGELLIGGSSLDIAKAKQLRESARVALDNVAMKVITQEVLYQAVVGGLHKSRNDFDLYFYRAAIWFGQQQEAHLKVLAQREENY